jgi:hypothetical protein
MTMEFGLRLILVSLCNFLFGNILFAFLWIFLHQYFAYWGIAIVCLILASIFSYQTQSRLILGRETGPFINFLYITFQLLGLFLAILLVPVISDRLRLSIILIQFGWSACYSLTSLLMLHKNIFTTKSIH